MKSDLESSEISSTEWLSLNQSLHELKQVNSKCLSIFYPLHKEKETISLLQQTRRNEYFEKIELRIEQKIQNLKKNPKLTGKFVKTMCIFGWIKK